MKVVAYLRRAIAYLRASTEDQRLGPEAQRAAIETWARTSGTDVVSWHLDQGVSGASPLDERPALLDALAALKPNQAGVLVVAKRDRIARDVVVAAMIDRAVAKAGASVVAADGAGNGDGPADELMRTILDGSAQYERALIRARTRAALAALRASGRRNGTVPYGHRVAADGSTVERCPDEQAVITAVYDLAAEGMSQRAIVDVLASRGVVSRAGKPLCRASIRNILGYNRSVVAHRP